MGAWATDANIPLHDAESRLRLRWSEWHQVQGRQRVIIQPAEKTGEVWRLGTGNEYFLVENRGPGLYDRAFTVRGLAIYHVDRTVKLSGQEGAFQDRLLDCVDCDKWHPYIMNMQGDGRFDLQTGVNAGQPVYEDDLFRDGDSLGEDSSGLAVGQDHQIASTNWYSGQPSGLSIRDIAVQTDGTIVATLEAPATGQCGDLLCSSGEACAPLTCESPGISNAAGCGCSTQSGIWVLALGAGLLLLEQRFRRAHERIFRR
jgi:hypothetical protein